MKLISCYIAGFGKFSGQTFDFSDLTVIKEDNGWGKTTLAAFIRCMLYGQDAGRGKGIESNDRAKYQPWRGGAYGGSLTFVYRGERYRVERTFGKTPSQDTAKVYDKNNTPFLGFGNGAENLGEILFGVDSESYRRSVYIPQGEIPLYGLPDDMKSRLLSLLTSDGEDGRAAQAIERLDIADRALRAKRKPAQGKLDKIDDRLLLLRRRREEGQYRLTRVEQLRGELADIEREMQTCEGKINALSKGLENAFRQEQLQMKKRAFEEGKEGLRRVEEKLSELERFFRKIPPEEISGINLEGIEQAVAKYYQHKRQWEEASGKVLEIESEYQRFTSLQTKKQTSEKFLDSYDKLLDKTKKANEKRKKKKLRGEKIIPPKRKSTKWIFLISFFVAVGGAFLADKNLYAGLGVFGAGLSGLAFIFFRGLPRYAKVPKDKYKVDITKDAEFSRQYKEACAELDEVQAALSKFPEDFEETYTKLVAERDYAKNQAGAVEGGIRNFLQNFRFAEIYDYRDAVEKLKNNIRMHAELKRERAIHKEKVEYATEEEGEGQSEIPVGDIPTLQAKKEREEVRYRQLSEMGAKRKVEAETLQNSFDERGLNAEEKELLEEKARLERRHQAILAAKSFLLRAKENLAGRYLAPVEKGCREYLAFFGEGKNGRAEKVLHFTAEGKPIFEEDGGYRELAYYSEGNRELLGICTRLALADAVFTQELPVLILDDPFVNLDDKKTAAAKKLVKELSKKYQIVYLTCKSERAL